jgi:hypothetical protein
MPRQTLRLGDRDKPDILVWQRFVRVTEDGFFGPQTEEATLRFQRAHGLLADGIVGPKTWAMADQEQVTPRAISWGSMFGADSGQITLPARKTPLTPDEAAKALAEGYKKFTGKWPTPVTLGLLIAQSAFETGNWKSIWGYNFGNAKATSADTHVQFLRCWEVKDGQKIWYDPPHPVCKFAAYLNPADGAAAYMKLLAKRPHWWTGLHSGTVQGFVNGLTTRPAYFTADPGEYARGMTDRLKQFADLATKYTKTNWAGVLGTGLVLTAIGLYVGVRATRG